MEGFFQGFANTLAEMVQKELTDRHIGLVVDEPPEKPGRDVFQVSILVMDWPSEPEKLPAREFLSKYARRWAIEMGIKLARPAVLTTYPMVLPRNIQQAALGRSSDLVLRCLVDYSLQTDSLVLRVDALAKWDD